MMTKAIYAVLSLAAIGVVAFVALGWWSRQSQHTVPGVAQGGLARCGDAPNCVSSTPGTEQAQHWIAPIAWPAGLAESERGAHVVAALEKLGGRVGNSATDATYYHAMFRSPLFGFVDDVEIINTPTQLEVRSASRVGHSDLGVNRERIESLRQLLGQAAPGGG